MDLINKELARVGIEVPQSPQQHYYGSPSEATTSPGPMYPPTNEHIPQPRPYGQAQFSGFDHFDSETGFEITPELFAAVSTLEPLSVRVGALNDFTA